MRHRSFGSAHADGGATGGRSIRSARRFVLALCAAAAIAAPIASRAQADFPSRPMKLVSPFNPGGAVDVLNRMIAEKMAARLKQPIVVEAIPGANTILGTQALLKAPPDGHTFMITTMSTQVNNPSLYSKLPYDADRDLAAITQVALGAVLLVGPVDAPYRDLPGFIEWARSQKRPVTFGSWGIGSSAHLYGEMLRRDYGIDPLHVPYKGEQPALIDVGFTPWANTPDEFAANLKSDVPVWAALIRASGAKAE